MTRKGLSTVQDQDYRRIPLHAKDGSIKAYAIVDPEDFERFGHLRWCLSGNGAVVMSTRRVGLEPYLHRAILGLTRGDRREGDHRDGDKLDNRRSNLRVATKSQNGQNRVRLSKRNSSGYRGVHQDTRDGTWSAAIMVEGKRHRRAGFKTAAEAGHAAAAMRAQHMPFAID
jgi:hypothetical protein